MPRLLPPVRTLRGFLTLLLTATSLALFSQLSIEVTGTNIPCFGLSSGTATAEIANGTAPFTFVWSNGGNTQTISNLSAGTYNLTVTDDNGLTGEGSITLTEPTRVTATISDPLECDAPFTIGAEPVGGVVPYTYNWSTGADTRAVSVPAGDYCVTVVDANLCGYVACTTVEENPPTVTLVDVDVLCAGDNDGAITANPAGGVAPYTYQWSNGAITRTITNLEPGVYSVVLTDARGCTATAATTISAPPALSGNISGDNTVCPGEASAFLMIVPSGGTPPYTYNWTPGNFGGQAIGPVGAGSYSVVVTDANNCTLTRSFVVITSDNVEVEIEGDNILCGAGTTGTLTASPVSGPVSQYVYNWSNGANGPTITNVGPGLYTVTATDANGCTGTATATVTTVDLDITLSSTPTSCTDNSDGSATATVNGGQQPYTYDWSNGGNTATITGLAPGIYGVTVTEAGQAACKVSGTVQVSAPEDITITAVPTNVDCFGANTGDIDLTVSGGTAPYAYSWSNGSVNEDLNDIPAGTYTVVVTDVNGCTESLVVNISQPAALVINSQVTNIACAGDETGRIVVTVSGGVQPYTYSWSNGATTRIISNLDAGDYTVTVTDANGCTLVETYTITEPPVIVVTGVVTDILCAGDNDGAINLTASGGTGDLSYSWSNGAVTEDLNGVAAGPYSVTVTDANECTATASFVIDAPADLVLMVTPDNVNCFGGNDGAIAVNVSGGTAPYVIRLDNVIVDADDLNNLPAGTYTVSIADNNGCAESTTVVIQQPTDFTVTNQITPVACLGDATGAINLTVTGATPGYSFAWSNGAVTEDISGLVAGDYTVTITDANGCIYTETYTVGSNSTINITGVASPADCNGENSGSVNITVSGGSGTYSFQWSNGATTEDLTNVGAGEYIVTVMDANECDAVATFMVTEPDEINLSITAPNITCGGTATGNISVFPSGGTGPFEYDWSNGDSGPTITNIGAGAYTVTVTDANGCTDVTSGIVLGEIPQLTCEVIVNQEPTMGNNGSISVEVDGGTIPYSYVWDDNSVNPNRDNLPAGTYAVTVTDANNCTTECMVTLQAFAGIGDFVWEDFNVNGQQDPGEPGIADYPVYLKNANGDIIDSTRTDENGNYAFLGLIPGNYSILFPPAPGGERTLFDTGDDATDNDADPDMNGMTQVYNLSPGEFDMTVDAGFFATPGGGIADPCNCLNNNTTDLDGQFTEIIEVRANRGQTWSIIERQNMFLLGGDNPPVLPVPVPLGTTMEEIPDPSDPTMSFYRYEFILVDSFQYSSVLSNGAFELTIANQCFYPEVQFTELPPEAICRFEAVFLLEGFGQLNGEGLPGEVIFTINGLPATEIDPMALPLGQYVITAEFVPDPAVDQSGLEICRPRLERQFILIDDCPAKLGDFVWLDANANGIQDPGEDGIEGVTVTVTSQDGTYTDVTTTDETGMYMFSVPPGTYKITFEEVEGLFPTSSNQGSNDELDSDMNPSTFMTPFYTVGPDEMDFSIDAGFFNPCIENINNPGTITANQVLCGPGNVPQPLFELAPATGGVGEIEYLWMYNTEDAGQDISYWQPIPNSNSPNFAPGVIYETTFFTRCVRRNNCPYLESNVLTIEVGDDAVANVSGPSVICVGEEAIFQAVNPGTNNVTWNFSGSSTVESANGATVSTVWQTFGNFSVTLTVVRNGCTSTQVFNVSVLNAPTQCGGSLTASGTVNNLQARDVMIEWELPADGTVQNFELERSVDGQNFASVAEVTAPQFTSGNGMNVYRQADVSPLAGRTFYRVRMLDEEYGDMLSNVIEMQLGETTTSLGRVFPNPASNGMIHVEMTEEGNMESSASIQMYDVRGNAIGARRYLAPGTGVINLEAEGQAAGVYFLRLTVGDRTETHRVILE